MEILSINVNKRWNTKYANFLKKVRPRNYNDYTLNFCKYLKGGKKKTRKRKRSKKRRTRRRRR